MPQLDDGTAVVFDTAPPGLRPKTNQDASSDGDSDDFEGESSEAEEPTRRITRGMKKERIEGEMQDDAFTMSKSNLQVIAPQPGFSDVTLQEDGRVQLVRDFMQFVYNEKPDLDVDIDYFRTMNQLWAQIVNVVTATFVNIVDMKHLLHIGADHGQPRKLIKYQDMERHVSDINRVAANDMEAARRQAQPLVMEAGGAHAHDKWFETFDGPLVVMYTVANLLKIKRLGFKKPLFDPASRFIEYVLEEKESHVDDHITACARVAQRESEAMGGNVMEKVLVLQDYIKRGSDWPQMSKEDYTTMWRILKAQQMGKERNSFKTLRIVDRSYQIKIDFTPDKHYAERVAAVKLRKALYVEQGITSDPERDILLERGDEDEQLRDLLDKISDVIQHGVPGSKTESYASSFMIAIAAGIALIFWEAVV
jgi:hypothetical protein